jgi:A118 family predicted phage portal protein
LFERIVKFVKDVIRRMFSVKNVKQAIGVDPAISDIMVNKIETWSKMYKGEADWVDNDAVHSLRLEQGIVREFANITLNEMTSKVTVDRLDKIYQNAIKDLNENLQSGLALGAFVIKPLGEDKVEYVTQDNFIPLEFDSRGRLMKVVFIETKQVDKDNIYRRFEYHAVDKKGLTITNKAYHSKSTNELGWEIPLTDIDDWADLVPEIWYPFPKPDFGYYRNPIKNTIDNSFNGVSVFDAKISTIKKADIQFGRLDWEFESGERAIHADPAAFKTDKVTGEKKLPKLNKRLYRAVDVAKKDGEELLDTYSPEMREQSFINGLEEYKRDIEFGVGLAYGDLSNPAIIEKTATEVRAAKLRKYNTVTAIQNNLRECLSDLVDALAFYNSLTTSGYKYVCDFKDSILIDEETERAQDKADVAIGAMTLLEYRMKWYHEDEKTAAKMINEPADVIP